MDQSKRERRSVPKVPESARRRRYTTAQKLAIVRECLVPGASLAGVAMALTLAARPAFYVSFVATW